MRKWPYLDVSVQQDSETYEIVDTTDEMLLIAAIYKELAELRTEAAATTLTIDRTVERAKRSFQQRCQRLDTLLVQVDRYVESLPIEPTRFRKKKEVSTKPRLRVAKCLVALVEWGTVLMVPLI